MTWLVRREAFPSLSTRPMQGYKAMFKDGVLVRDSWMKIMFKDAHIGYSHTQVDANEADATSQYLVQNRTVMRLKILGENRNVSVKAHATLDAMYQLQTFLFGLTSDAYSLSAVGTRTGEEAYDVVINTAGTRQKVEVHIPNDAIVYSPMVEMALVQLRPGRQMTVRTFNPMSMATSDIVVKALRRETIRHQGEDVETVVLQADYQGMGVLSWLNTDGQMLRQETALGWIMVACPADEALAVSSDGKDLTDLLISTAVSASAPISRPRTRERLDVLLRGAATDPTAMQTHRQTARKEDDGSVALVLRRDTLPGNTVTIAEAGAAHPEYLEASPFIQANDPELRRRARAIVGAETDSLKASLAIHNWLRKNMLREPTVSVPSALAVLRTMKGDCNEHTYLFVGLARAIGIPAKITVGIVYSEGAFYYHAWPGVFVGRWLEMDPTLDQDAVDATHIKLLEGELADQMQLMAMIGRLKVDVRESPEPAGHGENDDSNRESQ